jgi:peptidoglycan/xylan/chitin deacetylase (PgdA/CDA1 family)
VTSSTRITWSGAKGGVGNRRPGIRVQILMLLIAKYSGLFALARMLTARKTRILAYHGIWLGEGRFGNFLYMSPEKFAARMALLERWGYPVVPLADHVSDIRCATVITIDDGWYGTWSVMLPVLERHGYPATLYLATYYCLNQKPVIDVALQYCFHAGNGVRVRDLHLPEYEFGPRRIDNAAGRQRALADALKISAALNNDAERQQFLIAICNCIGIDYDRIVTSRWFHFMNSAEVADAAARGICVEAHTHRHRITDQGEDCLAQEIATNAAYIEALTGRRPEHFCYPNGRFSAALWPVLESCHMASATTTDTGLVDRATPRYAMPRILDGQEVSDLEFEAEMCGFLEISRRFRSIGRKPTRGEHRGAQ